MNEEYEHRLRFIPYHGKEVLLIDASNLSNEEKLLEFIAFRHRFLTELEVPDKSLLVIADITNIKQTPKVIEALKKSHAITKKLYKQVCAVGVVGFKKSLLKILNKVNRGSIIPKRTRDEALDFLTTI